MAHLDPRLARARRNRPASAISRLLGVMILLAFFATVGVLFYREYSPELTQVSQPMAQRETLPK
jgi:hypothetical protein